MKCAKIKLVEQGKQDQCGNSNMRSMLENKIKEIGKCIRDLEEESSSKIRETVKLEETVMRLSDKLQEKENTIERERINWKEYKNNVNEQLRILVLEMTEIISTYRKKALFINFRKDCEKCCTCNSSKNRYVVDEKSDNLQERYAKLRDLAKKMKMKIDDQMAELTKERERTAQLTNQAMRSQNLQLECDKLSDSLDSKTKEVKQIQKELIDHVTVRQRLTKQINELTAGIATHKSMVQSLQNHKESLECKVKSLLSQLDDCRKEVSALQVVRKEQEKTITQLKVSLKDAEKYHHKLTEQIDDLKLMVGTLNQVKEEAKNYRNEICILKGSLDNVQEISEKRQNELVEVLEKYEIEKSAVQRLTLEISDLLRSYGDMKREYELSRKMDTSKMNELRLDLDLYMEKCNRQKREMATIQKEFDEYKLKAHDILEKHDAESNWKEQKKQMECNIGLLQDTVTTLNEKLNNIRCELESNIMDMTILRTTNEQLEDKIKTLQEELLQMEYKFQELSQKHNLYKADMEELILSHKTEIDGKIMLEKNIVDLKKQLEETDNQLLSKVSSIISDELENKQDKKQTSSCSHHERRRVRRVSSSSSCINKPVYSSAPVSLEELLSNGKAHSLDGDLEAEEDVADLKHQLRRDKIRIKHLTELVDEAECNASRSELQLSFLKEEVRRLQRSFERQTHLENSEYLKNIIFKFLVLQNAEERIRLVPVIETMLKLSPIETKQLNLMAKGNNIEGSSWSNLLNWR